MNQRFYSGGLGVRSVCYELDYLFGIFRSENKRNISPVAETENICFFDIVLIHKIIKVFCKLIQRKRLVPKGRFAVTAGIYGNYMVLFGKVLCHIVEYRMILAVSVKEYQGLSAAHFFIKKFYIHYYSPLLIKLAAKINFHKLFYFVF